MSKISTNAEISAIIMAAQGSAPSTPASSYNKLYFKSDGLYFVDDGGTEHGPLATGTAAVNLVKVALKAEIMALVSQAEFRLAAQMAEIDSTNRAVIRAEALALVNQVEYRLAAQIPDVLAMQVFT